jgi:hypothetical protein
MRKNGARQISFRQYRFTDLFLFALILVVFELIVHFAFIAYQGDFFFSPMLIVALLVMMRWGWVSVFYAVGDGLLYCLLNSGNEGFGNHFYAIYMIGNAFVLLLLLMTKFMGKEKIRSKWYFSALYVVLGWFSVVIGRTLVSLPFGIAFIDAFTAQLSDLISLALALVLVLIFRRLDGMFEDQKHYLFRLEKERKEEAVRDTYGEEPLDDEMFKIDRKTIFGDENDKK